MKIKRKKYIILQIMLVSISFFVNNVYFKVVLNKYSHVVYANKFDEKHCNQQQMIRYGPRSINLYPMLRGPPLLFIIPFSL